MGMTGIMQGPAGLAGIFALAKSGRGQGTRSHTPDPAV